MRYVDFPELFDIANFSQEVYQRSLTLESTANAGSFDGGKKKFPWFQKEK
jgi:hypothetical protein